MKTTYFVLLFTLHANCKTSIMLYEHGVTSLRIVTIRDMEYVQDIIENSKFNKC